MNAPLRTVGSGMWCCRGSLARSAPGLLVQPSAGALAVKDESVRSSAVTGCGGVGTAGRVGCTAGSGSVSSPMTYWCLAAPDHEPLRTAGW